MFLSSPFVSKGIVNNNHVLNILRLWCLSKFFLHHKWSQGWLLVINWNIWVTHELPWHGILRNQEISGKSQNFIQLLPSAQSSQNENFVSTSKNLLKNRNWTVVLYFTWKLEFVSNILRMIVVYRSVFFLISNNGMYRI